MFKVLLVNNFYNLYYKLSIIDKGENSCKIQYN